MIQTFTQLLYKRNNYTETPSTRLNYIFRFIKFNTRRKSFIIYRSSKLFKSAKFDFHPVRKDIVNNLSQNPPVYLKVCLRKK